MAYKIPDNAKWIPCRACGKEITFIINENGRNIPITKEGNNHFIDCPARDRFRKREVKEVKNKPDGTLKNWEMKT